MRCLLTCRSTIVNAGAKILFVCLTFSHITHTRRGYDRAEYRQFPERYRPIFHETVRLSLLACPSIPCACADVRFSDRWVHTHAYTHFLP